MNSHSPLFDFDPSKQAIFMPSKLWALPEKMVFAFLGNISDDLAKEKGWEKIYKLPAITSGGYQVYQVNIKGQKIGIINAPLGASASAMVLEELIACNVNKVLAIGCCGALVDLPEKKFLIPIRALRDEGTSYKYCSLNKNPKNIIKNLFKKHNKNNHKWEIELDKKTASKIANELSKLNIENNFCSVWSTDALYRETSKIVEKRKKQGYTAVDMECSALAAVANFRNIEFGEILFTADSLSDPNEHNPRNFAIDYRQTALDLAIAVIEKL